MKRLPRSTLFTGLCFVLFLMVLFPMLEGSEQTSPRKTDPGSSTLVSNEEPVNSPSLEIPEVSASSAIVIEAKTGLVLYEKNSKQKAYPASTTKIMTALLALEEVGLDDQVTVPANASGTEGSSIYLAVGEQLSVRDLLYGLMLRSGNDASLAIAEYVSPTTADFVRLMNEKAKEIGALNTHFSNPNGLYATDHYTTAFDMALIAKEAMNNADFKAIVGAKSWKADREEGKYSYFYNKNKVVFQYPGGTGVKIGYTKASGRTLVASSERDGLSVICVVMNAPNWFNDSYHLMDYAHKAYEMATVASPERVLKAVPVEQGDRDHVMIGPKEPVLCPVKTGEELNIAVAYDVPESIKAPVHRWQEAGALQVFVNGILLFSQPLYYLEDVPYVPPGA